MNSISTMCELYGVSRSGYYAWKKRAPSERTQTNQQLLGKIKALFRDSDESYGSPRIYGVLKTQGNNIGRNRIARLMRESGLRARSARIYRPNPGHHAFYATFDNESLHTLATEPNRVWVGDVTYLRVGRQKRYLAVVMDKFSRRIVGWAWGKDRTTRLTLKAFNRAIQNRRPKPGLIFHSDRGIEYSAFAFRDRLAKLGVTQSMNRPRRMDDNAFMESFFHTFKSDKYHGRQYSSIDQLYQVVKTYLPFYNRLRAHTSLGCLSPIAYEQAN